MHKREMQDLRSYMIVIL